MSPAPGEHAPLLPPRRCAACQAKPVAWVKPRVDYCYDCMPGGPYTPPPCMRCGSTNYYSQGRCAQCHPAAPAQPGACKECLAWGVYRRHNWKCWVCRWWQSHYPQGVCDYCHRDTRVGDQGACRLCLEQARLLQEPGRPLDLAAANRHGQQLFFANLQFQRARTPRLAPARRRGVGPSTAPFSPSGWSQPVLVDVAPDPELVRQRALVEDSELTRYCAGVVLEHAERLGWSNRQRNDVIRSLRLLQTLREDPTAKVRASDVLQLPGYGGNIISTLDVLDAAGLLIDDRPRPIETYFTAKTALLPPVMREQLEIWLAVMIDGATNAPRQRARDPLTVKVHVMGITPVVTAWAEAGHQSLAEITPADVITALPASGSQRVWAEIGLRSLFKTLKARKLIFANPMRGMKSTTTQATVPLPLDTRLIRGELNSTNPAVALAVALVAFHALTAKQVAALRLTDIADGRLRLPGRSIPLAQPVRDRLTRWLDHRARTWPNSQNPHLLITRRSAPRLVPVSRTFPWRISSVKPRALRDDRILAEVRATGGDHRRLADLFGVSINAAGRYVDTLEHPDLAAAGTHVRGTSTPT